MNLIIWLIVGLVAGVVAKMITPQDEKGGWVSSLIIGIIGSFVGGFLGGMLGLQRLFGTGLIGSLILAIPGALLVLYIYHKYLAEKLNLPI